MKKIVAGGKERKDSVFNALKEINEKTISYVLIHDSARPLVDEKLIERAVKNVKKYNAVVPVIKPRETLKSGKYFVGKTIDRNSFFLAQTPQAFELKLIKKAHEHAIKNKLFSTDDCFLVEKIGKKVKMIPGDEKNIKITFPLDLSIAERLLKKKNEKD